ncbi:heparinase II/III family protein [Roseibium salinum]|uniref:heparinase II/III domain-containing protein n=1 Tax=Roseibium salinum TaxID=1604349 RepID=UPI0035EF4068
MFAACLPDLGDILSRFVPGRPHSDRAWWDGLSGEVRARLIAGGEAVLATDWPVLTAKAYRAYTETGNRVLFETDYFARRRRLNALALAELAEGKGRFVDGLVDGLFLVLEESGWQLPAHNAHERGGTRAPLPDPNRPVIDLFAAETGAQLAVISSVLGDTLESVSPLIVERIDREVTRRITRPYLDRHFWWMGRGDEPMNNWTAWCTQNVLISTFARPTDQETRRAVITRAAHSLDAFLKDYGEDGACEEGALYYRRAALCLFGALKVLEEAAPGVFSPIWSQPKIRNMAEFILNMHVDGHYYINFADASAVLDPCGAQEFLFGKAVGSDALCALAARDVLHDPEPELPQEINLFQRLLAISTQPEIRAFGDRPVLKGDIYYPSCGLFIARDERFVVAAKAGDNDDGHNHNDVGSVTVYKSGRPVLIDVGVETYTARTFSPERYGIWTMQSAYHNLPSFGGIQQQAGAAHAASDVSVDMGESASVISMDIAGAYPADARLVSYRRTLRLIKGSAVEIVDEFDGERPPVLSLMTQETPVLTDAGLRIGDLADIDITGMDEPVIEEIPIGDPRLRLAWPEQIYRVLIPFNGRVLRLRIT